MSDEDFFKKIAGTPLAPHLKIIKSGKGPSVKKSFGGQTRVQMRGLQEARAELASLRTRVGSKVFSDPDERAMSIQTRLQRAVFEAYNKSATGRMARGIRAKVTKIGAPGGKVETIIRITMFNYRESRFLTNIGGGGYFKEYPVPPYTIFAKGAGFDKNITPTGFGRRGRGTQELTDKSKVRIATSQATSRLKVPRRGSFFTAGRQPGRGGGESRFINDVLGRADPGDRQSSFFFYPLWVNHPGFSRDVISEVASEEGARFQTEIVSAVTLSHGQLQTKSTIVSTDIPITGTEVRQSAKGASVDLPIFLTRAGFGGNQ